MANVLVVYCSMTGNTQAAAEAVAEGARRTGAEVTVKRAADTGLDDLLSCDGVAFGSYDAFSYMGGELKACLDRIYYPLQDHAASKPCACFLSHGGGGGGLVSLEALTSACKFRKVAESVSVKGRPDAAATAALSSLGEALATAAAS